MSSSPGPPVPDPPPRPVTAFTSWSHASNASAAAGDDAARRRADEAWRDEVFDFVAALRRFGVDADVDLAHLSDRGVDWTRFGPSQIQRCDVTLVVVNGAWRRAWEESGPPTLGRGAAAEADVLRSLFVRDREAFQRQVTLVLLPGSDDADIPPGLDRVPRVRVPSIDQAGLTELLRMLTGQPQFPLPPVGAVPPLPPTPRAAIEHRTVPDSPGGVQVSGPTETVPIHAASAGGLPDEVPTSLDNAAAARSVHSGSAADAAAELRDEIALLSSLLRSLPEPLAHEGPHLPWYRAWHQTRGQLATLERQLAALQQAAPAEPPAPDRSGLTQGLDQVLEQVKGQLERSNRCWLVLVALVHRRQTQPPPPQTGSMRERRREQITRWAERCAPVVPVDTTTAVLRRPGRVVFTGEHDRGPQLAARSSRWRAELGDDGSGVVAAAVADQPRVRDGTGIRGWPGEPGETLLEAEVYLPVRRDRLEVWLLTGLELLADHLQHTAGDLDVVAVQAHLALPARLTLPGTHNPRPLGLRLVDEHRDEQWRRVEDAAVPEANDLPLGADPPTSSAVQARLLTLREPHQLVRTARRLAVELLEHFGVEDTHVLAEDGTLHALAAAEADQQLVHQHAQALGLPADPYSPAERRRRYIDGVAAARRWLTPGYPPQTHERPAAPDER